MSDPTLVETPTWLNAYFWGTAFLWTLLVLALAAWHHLSDLAVAWFTSDTPDPAVVTVAGYGASWGLGLLGLAAMRWRLRGRLIGQRRSEQRAARLGLALDQAGQAALLLDQQGRFQYANEASCRILEYSRDELLNLSMIDVDVATASGWSDRWSELETRRSLLFTSHHRTRTGRVFPVEIHASYLDDDGRGYVLALTRDITEREQRAREAATHRKILDALFQCTPGFVFVLAEDGQFLRWNQRYQKLLGWSDEDMARLRALDTVSHRDQTRVAARLRDVLARGDSFAELTPVDRDGRERGRYYATGVRAEIEGKLHVVGVAIDISEQMAARAALHESEQTYREIFNATSDALLIHDETGRVLDANDQAYTLFGYDWKTTLRPSIGNLDLGENPYSQTKAEEWVRRAIQKGPQVFEWRSKRLNGELLWTEVALRASRIGGHLRVIAAVRDITARKQADEALREYQQTINAIVETSQDLVWAIDLSGHHTYLNPAVEKILGYSPTEVRWIGMEKLIHPEDRWIVDSQWPGWIETRQGWNNQVLRWRCKDDSYRYLESTAVPVLGPDGELLGFRGVDRDITERVQVERALRASEARLNEAQRLAHVGTWEWDPVSDSLLCSEELLRILEIDPQRYALRYQDVLDRVHPDDVERVRRSHGEPMDSQAPYQIEHRLCFADGRVKYVYQQGQTIQDAEGQPIRSIGTVQDITQRKQAEISLKESTQRLQALSRRLLSVQEEERRMLARELHDDFGQQLAAFKLNLGLLSRGMHGEAEQRRITDCLDIANDLLERLRDIARDLRPSVLDDLGLAAALHWYARRQTERSGCEITVLDRFSPLPPEIETAMFRITQEAVNNAIRHGGARHITVTAEATAQGLALAIQDDGGGFDPTAASSKPDAGLGLNSMRERAELLDGWFTLTSQVGTGTRIEVFIPLVEKDA